MWEKRTFLLLLNNVTKYCELAGLRRETLSLPYSSAATQKGILGGGNTCALAEFVAKKVGFFKVVVRSALKMPVFWALLKRPFSPAISATLFPRRGATEGSPRKHTLVLFESVFDTHALLFPTHRRSRKMGEGGMYRKKPTSRPNVDDTNTEFFVFYTHLRGWANF